MAALIRNIDNKMDTASVTVPYKPILRCVTSRIFVAQLAGGRGSSASGESATELMARQS
jgi:hypothetical protein